MSAEQVFFSAVSVIFSHLFLQNTCQNCQKGGHEDNCFFQKKGRTKRCTRCSKGRKACFNVPKSRTKRNSKVIKCDIESDGKEEVKGSEEGKIDEQEEDCHKQEQPGIISISLSTSLPPIIGSKRNPQASPENTSSRPSKSLSREKQSPLFTPTSMRTLSPSSPIPAPQPSEFSAEQQRNIERINNILAMAGPLAADYRTFLENQKILDQEGITLMAQLDTIATTTDTLYRSPQLGSLLTQEQFNIFRASRDELIGVLSESTPINSSLDAAPRVLLSGSMQSDRRVTRLIHQLRWISDYVGGLNHT